MNTKVRWALTLALVLAGLSLGSIAVTNASPRPSRAPRDARGIDLAPPGRTPTYGAGGFAFTAPLAMPKPTPNPQVFVTQQAEPEIKIDIFGNIYLTAINGVPGGTNLWKSVDNGVTFTDLGQPDGAQDHCPDPLLCPAAGGGDDSIDVSTGGYLYVSSLWLGDVTVSTSFDGGLGGVLPGQAWQVNPAATTVSAADDRQWLVAYGPETVYMSFREAPGTGTLLFVKSTDAGKTFAGVPTVMRLGNSVQGNLVVDPYNGNLYSTTIPASEPTKINLLKSTDAGASWAESTAYTGAAGTNPGLKFTILTVDRGGNLHLAFASGTAATLANTHVYIMSSTDQGATWLPPVQVDSSLNSNVMPWIVGGSPGVVDITWLGSDVATPSTPGNWHVYFAQMTNGVSNTPHFAQVRVTTNPMHDKVICFNGTGCATGTRDLLEYYAMTLDPEGRAHIAYADSVTDCPDGSCFTKAWYTKQTDNVVAYTPPSPPAPATFSANLAVGSPGSEPSIWVDSFNCIYVTAPGAPWVWKSVNNGASFLPPVNPVADEATLTGGDEDIISLPRLDAPGTRPDQLYFTDLGLTTCHIRKSSDGGASWFRPGPGGSASDVSVSSDRQWLAGDQNVPAGVAGAPAQVIYHWEHELASEAMRFSSSVDDNPWVPQSGMTDPELFDPVMNTFPNTNPGPIFVNKQTHRVFALFNGSVIVPNNAVDPPFGKLLNVWEADAAPPLSAATGVQDVQNHPVFKGTYDSPNNPPPSVGPPVGPNYGTNNANIFPAGDIDSAGNIYVAWSMNNSRTNEFSVWMAISRDQGKTYYGPFPVSSGPLTADETVVFPWVAAGDEGRVDIVYYKTTTVGDPNELPAGPAGAEWNVFFAQSLNAHTREPVFTVSQISDHVIHRGPISTGGLLGSSDRSLLDFFEVAVGPDGIANVIWADNGNAATHAEYARQLTGPSVKVNPTFPTCLEQVGVQLASVVSRKTHGPQGDFDVPLPLTGAPGIECRIGQPNNGDHKLIFTFANPLQSVGSASSSQGTASGQINPSDPRQYIVMLSGVNDDQTITVTLTNVNDGIQTGTVSVQMMVLPGDTNEDERVNIADTNQTKSRSGQLTAASNYRSDVNLDGRINVADTNFVKAHSGSP